MANLSKKVLAEVGRDCYRAFGLRPVLMDLEGRIADGTDPLSECAKVRRSRNYALHESVNWGAPHVFPIGRFVRSWVVALEDRRIVYGGLIGGHVLIESEGGGPEEHAQSLVAVGLPGKAAVAYVRRLPVWPQARVAEAGGFLEKAFYQFSGWTPVLMRENRLRIQQQQQITLAAEDQKKRGETAAYPFEKERVLLSLIKAGDRNEARRVLNDMLAAMYMTSSELPVLRARAIEMMGYLTRAAVEDSVLVEHVIERNHQWARRLIEASDFEDLSRVLTQALDDFIETIYLHGFNRSNSRVSRALDFIAENYMKPISLRDVAGAIGLSSFRTAHLVKRHMGKSVVQLIHQVRVQRARYLLEKTAKSCTDIAYEVGYGDQSYFTRHFRRIAGITPARYRRAGVRSSDLAAAGG
jgi:AraC-like DNA-binding protein